MKRAARFLPALLWASLIVMLSSQPRLPNLPMTFNGIDKVLHAVFFGVLCGWVVFGFGTTKPRALLVGILATSLFGGLDEVHQMFVPGRLPDVVDWIADTVGASVAALLMRWRFG